MHPMLAAGAAGALLWWYLAERSKLDARKKVIAQKTGGHMGAVGSGKPGAVAQAAAASAKKGTLVGDIVQESPGELALSAGVPLEVYSLARMIASEHGSDGPEIKTAVGFAAWNEARRRGTTITKLMTASKKSPGHFGAQHMGRYASTARDPRAIDLAIAGKILGGALSDPTGGANQFDAPKTQRILHKRDPSKFPTPEKVAANRIAGGQEMVSIPGVDADYLRFWRPRSQA